MVSQNVEYYFWLNVMKYSIFSFVEIYTNTYSKRRVLGKWLYILVGYPFTHDTTLNFKYLHLFRIKIFFCNSYEEVDEVNFKVNKMTNLNNPI